ncbi:MAG: hypothetical protein HFG09_09850 [Oscillibacter sp.]|nr:hypothetical protein [Oscillibacter sp.]
MTEQARLLDIENNREITKETDSQFLFEYQRAILLTLRDRGVLNETQYQYAEENLKKQLKQS